MATAIHQYEDKLLDFAYGELPAPEASAVESHLKTCPRCTQALDQIRGVRTTMSALPQEPAPTQGLESLLAYAEQAAARNAAAPSAAVPWWRRVIAPLAGAMALTLVAVVAVKTQKEGDLDFSKEKAMAEATPREETTRGQPEPVLAPVVAAAPQGDLDSLKEGDERAPEAKKVAEKMKAGKISGASTSDRKAKEERNWDSKTADNAYAQELGATKAPADGRQDLGNAIATATKESKTKREPDMTNYGGPKGGTQGNRYEEQQALNDKLEARVEARPPAPSMGVSTKPQAMPPAVAAKPVTPSPAPAQVAIEQPQKSSAPSLGLNLPSSVGTGSSSGYGGGLRGSSAPTYKKSPSRESANEDEIAARGTDDMADGKRLNKDVEVQQRDQNATARGYLDAARAASNQGDRQEEVKQALAALQTNVKGAPRAEALNRLCSAFEALGEEGKADKFCDALLTEFPTTAAAKVVANRRNNVQRPAPAKASKQPSYDSSPAEKADMPKAEPASQKPASAY